MTGCLNPRASCIPLSVPSPTISLVLLLPSYVVSSSNRLMPSWTSVWPLVAFECSPNRRNYSFMMKGFTAASSSTRSWGCPAARGRVAEAKVPGASSQAARTSRWGMTTGKGNKIRRGKVNWGKVYSPAKCLSSPLFL